MTLDEIQALYDQGRFAQAKTAVWEEIYEEKTKKDVGKLKVIRAWCHWRLQEWGDARQWLQEAEDAGGAELETKRLRAYFAAYRDKDDAKLQAIAQELPSDISVHNALVIRARDKDSTLDHAAVLTALARFAGSTLEEAHLYHNGARFLLTKARNQGDISTAFAMIRLALDKYGPGNWHHKGAALFWKSKIAEALGDREEALHAAEQSLFAWSEALARDPQNKGFQDNRDNAIKRIAELQ